MNAFNTLKQVFVMHFKYDILCVYAIQVFNQTNVVVFTFWESIVPVFANDFKSIT